MQLDHIKLDDLNPSKLNVRKYGAKDVCDLIPSIRANGILQPLLVRPGSGENTAGFEIIAGQRRYHACLALSEQGDTRIDALPCMIMDSQDDAAAIEASLVENIARLPMDEVDQYKAFAALIKAGQTKENVAAHFGCTVRLVAQRMAIANLHAPILTAYRNGDIKAETLRLLTMATKAQQKDWLVLLRGADTWPPQGRALKDWLFGGAYIKAQNAMFDVDESGLTLVGDLFGEDAYFADSAAFWEHQSGAIAALSDQYKAKGWGVVIHETGKHWASWDHVSVSKTDGGQIHIEVAQNGEVSVHEGFLNSAVYAKRQKAEAGDAPRAAQRELSKPLQNYIDLHRHAAVRADLLQNPETALRLMLAHAIAGSSLWSVEPERQRASKEATADSLAANPAQIAFEAERSVIAELLGLVQKDADEQPYIVPRGQDYGARHGLNDLFTTLRGLSEEQVRRVSAFLMAETLEVGSETIDGLGELFDTDTKKSWQPDEAFFDLLRSKPAINAMVFELAGENVAASNLTATAKAQKTILRDCLSGARNAEVEDWQPRYMCFPMQQYCEAS